MIIRDRIDITKTSSGRIIDRVWMTGRIVDGGFGVIDGISGINFCGADGCYIWTCTGPSRVENIEIRAETAGWAVDVPRVV